MIIFIISILVLTILFAYLYKAKIIEVCPICAGVVLTWVGGLIGTYANQSWADPLILAILMGASLGALADKYGNKYGLLWKSSLVVLGFPAIYLLLQKRSLFGIVLLITIAILTIVITKRTKSKVSHKEDIFKDCC